MNTNWSASFFYRSTARVGLAAALGLGLTLPAQALVWRNDITDQEVQALAQQNQFSGVGSVTGGGTAVAIAPGWVLTARHVVDNGTREVFFLNGQSYFGTSVSRAGSDVALIQLDANQQLPANTVFIAPNRNVDPVGELIWKVGRGQAGPLGTPSGDLLPSGTLRAGTNVVQAARSTPIDPNSLTFNNSNTAANSTAFEVTTAPGDSGGPMMIQQNHQWFIAGTTFGAIGGIGFIDAEVAAVYDWIETTTGIDFDSRVQAAPTELFWDGNAAADGVQAGGGSWATDRPNFYAAATGFNHTWENDAPITAVFGTPTTNAAVINVADDITVSEIRFAPIAPGSGPFQIVDGAGVLRAAVGGATIETQTFARLNATLAGGNDFTKTGSGTLQFDGDNTGFGGEINVADGILRTDVAEAFGNGGFTANTRTTVLDGGTLQFNGSGVNTAEYFRLTGRGSTGSNGALWVSEGDHVFTERVGLLADSTVNVSANASATFGGSFGQFFNPRILTKAGDGTIVLDNISNIAGLVVADGTLAGDGGVNGSLSVRAGAEFRPGDSASAAGLGDFATDDLTLDLASTLFIDLDPALAAIDVVNVTGTVNLAGSLNLNLLTAPIGDDLWVILDNDGSDAVLGEFDNGSTITTSFGGVSYDFAIFTDAGDGNDVALQLMPEPTTTGLLMAAASVLGRRRRR
ncbi:MAG: trypsin-like serine protease [Planctomycetota bacterium]